MAEKAKDLVTSYSVITGGKLIGHEELQKALEDGYRVVDVIPTPAATAGTSSGAVVVTVVLSNGNGAVYLGGKR
jgi:hypothetical protein